MFGLGKLGKMGRVGGVRTTIASILAKYSGSHLWDFGVSADKVAAGAGMTAAQFLAAYPTHALFQDTAGTTPAYQITHPVALCKDAVGTAHASQSTSTKRPVLSARVNLLVATEDFSSASWAKDSCTIGVNAVANHRGDVTADKVISAAASTQTGVGQSFTALAASYKHLVYIKAAGAGFAQMLWSTNRSTDYLNIDLSTGAITGTYAAASANAMGGGWWEVSITSSLSAGACTAYVWLVNSGAAARGATYTGDGTSGIYLWGADTRPANSPTNLPAYQRVTTSTDYDTVGFPLRAVWDGVDDCLVVPTLDLSITDKVTVVAGVQKVGTTSWAALLEFTGNPDSTAGAFSFNAPGSAADTFYASARGATANATKTVTGYASPVSAVLTNKADLSAATSTATNTFSVNGATVSAAGGGSAPGGGNFASAGLYIGQRNGSTYPFSGAIQSITIIPALITASETAVIEASVNNSMGKVY